MSSAVCFSLDQSKILLSCNGLKQFLSIVMFDMKGFYLSISLAIQGHDGPLVIFTGLIMKKKRFWRTLAFLYSILCPLFNSIPNDKILYHSKLKEFADDKINVTLKLKFVLGRVENIIRKTENAGYQHFLLYPQLFKKASFSGSLKAMTVL